ncbi:MAG: peptide chain release factor N(5)-glutamine methyltransferase [Gammaproteobacteria bacterium]|nr:peptide chain release factor N(5)-glutamine methyltransferase [Gammaproteobacteria bacterium]
MAAEPLTLRQALLESRTQLASCSDSPAVDAEWLWSHALHRSRSWLLTHPEWPLTPAEQARGESLIRRRQDGHSVAHLCGECEFLDFSVRLTSQVLAPRPETELLVEQALHGLPHRARVLEWGTGSGVLALAIARARPDCQILALDHSRAAVKLAQSNALRLRLKNVRFVRADWRHPWPEGTFDLILGNPPYVALHDSHLQSPGVCQEPRSALVTPARGTQTIRVLAAQARRHAHRRTRLLLEHGANQGDVCRKIVRRAGWGRAKTLLDLAGLPRVCLASLQHHRLGR